jgi:hypothetical protein
VRRLGEIPHAGEDYACKYRQKLDVLSIIVMVGYVFVILLAQQRYRHAVKVFAPIKHQIPRALFLVGNGC